MEIKIRARVKATDGFSKIRIKAAFVRPHGCSELRAEGFNRYRVGGRDVIRCRVVASTRASAVSTDYVAFRPRGSDEDPRRREGGKVGAAELLLFGLTRRIIGRRRVGVNDANVF